MPCNCNTPSPCGNNCKVNSKDVCYTGIDLTCIDIFPSSHTVENYLIKNKIMKSSKDFWRFSLHFTFNDISVDKTCVYIKVQKEGLPYLIIIILKFKYNKIMIKNQAFSIFHILEFQYNH